jgi:hypothetical protein
MSPSLKISAETAISVYKNVQKSLKLGGNLNPAGVQLKLKGLNLDLKEIESVLCPA